MLTTNERDKNHFVQKSDWHALTKMNGTKNELNLPLLRVDENIDGKKSCNHQEKFKPQIRFCQQIIKPFLTERWI